MVDIPKIYEDAANWWYHYYAEGEDARIEELSPKHFALSNKKATPDFENLVYDCGICHPQIGVTVTPQKSIVLIKTTVGCSSSGPEYVAKSPYIVGYFRVGKIDANRELIHMDPTDSCLLLENPIRLDSTLAKELFTKKPEAYWERSDLFVRRVGSTLRNKRATPAELEVALREMVKRVNHGAKNYLGKKI